MNREHKTPDRYSDMPCDRPRRDGCEHANLERPGAQAHPRASSWSRVLAERTRPGRLN